MRDLAEIETTEDAGRLLPSFGPAWDAAIEAGIDVTMLEHNLGLTPVERLRQMMRANRFLAEAQSRTVPAHVLRAREEQRLQEKLSSLGPELED